MKMQGADRFGKADKVVSVPEDWSPGADGNLSEFDEAVDQVLHLAAQLARDLVGAHQAAAAMIVGGDWRGMRKYFSLSSKYSDWFGYRTPAVGYGIHNLPIATNKPMRLTQAELEAHPEWKGFGKQADTHPPMRGWLAVPVIGLDGRNYGMLQLSDKYDDAEFNEMDEQLLARLAALTAYALDAICALFNHHSLGHRDRD